MDLQKRLSRARTRLLLDHPFYGTLVLRLPLVEDSRVETATTNGERIRYNPTFVNGLTDNELMGVLAHEVLHIAHGHVWRRGGRETERWNTAADYAINHVIVESGLELPAKALLDPIYTGSAERIYSQLPKSSPQGENTQSQSGRGGSEHGQSGSSGLPAPTTAGDEANPAQPERDALPEKVEGADGPVSDPGGCGAVEDPPEGTDTSALESDWKVAVSQAAMAVRGQGRLPGELERLVDEILNPKVPWETLLRDFVERSARNDYNWTRPNRRYLSGGIILPSLISEELPAIVVAVDTSGSIGPSELDQFASEVSAVLGAYDTKIHLVYCDSVVQGTGELTRADLPLNLKPKGGGGTDFRPVFDWVTKEGLEPACLIYLTDLYGQFPIQAPDYPVMWVRVHGAVRAPFGDTIEM